MSHISDTQYLNARKLVDSEIEKLHNLLKKHCDVEKIDFGHIGDLHKVYNDIKDLNNFLNSTRI